MTRIVEHDDSIIELEACQVESLAPLDENLAKCQFRLLPNKEKFVHQKKQFGHP